MLFAEKSSLCQLREICSQTVLTQIYCSKLFGRNSGFVAVVAWKASLACEINPTETCHNMRGMLRFSVYPCSMHRRSQGGMAPQIFSISSHFVLWEAASQSKILMPAWSQTSWAPQKILGVLRHWLLFFGRMSKILLAIVCESRTVASHHFSYVCICNRNTISVSNFFLYAIFAPKLLFLYNGIKPQLSSVLTPESQYENWRYSSVFTAVFFMKFSNRLVLWNSTAWVDITHRTYKLITSFTARKQQP